MNWKENGSGYIAKSDDGKWSAYIRQEAAMCVWRVYKEGQVQLAGFSDNVENAKYKIEKAVADDAS